MTTKDSKYIEGIGRRKTSVARVRITPSSKNTFKVNGRDFASYFPTLELRSLVEAPINESGSKGFTISAEIKGGGIHSQAEAMKHGIGRAIAKFDESLRRKLKSAGFLKRDPRAKERRKFGLKKARKAPQWSKR